MPHIVIREEDASATSRVTEEYNVAYIPGLRATETSGDELIEFETPTLFKKTSDFRKAILGDAKKKIDITEVGVNALLAERLLSLGLYVLYEAFDTTVEKEGNISPDFSKLKDKGLYPVKFLTTGAYANMDKIDSMLECAKYRKDCIALIDHDKDMTESGLSFAESVHDAFNKLQNTNDELKYGAAFTPWCKFSLSNETLELPGSFAYLSAFANSIQSRPDWYASAGAKGGLIPGLVAPLELLGDADARILQAREITADGDFADTDNIGIAVNPICNVRPFGYVVWGNRTLINNDGDLIFSSFLNVRNICCDLSKELYNTSREFTFEQNSDILWLNFYNRMAKTLDKMVSGNGIRGYKLLQEPTERKACLKARLKVRPVEAVEDFDLTLEMTDSIEEVTEE